MECVFHHKFKKWVPIGVSTKCVLPNIDEFLYYSNPKIKYSANTHVTNHRRKQPSLQSNQFFSNRREEEKKSHHKNKQSKHTHSVRHSAHTRKKKVITHSASVSFQARGGILPVAEEQSRTRGSQSSGVEDQPQCPGMWHSSSPSARSLSRAPSSPPPSFTQSPSPPRSLVRDGQTSPHRPRLVVSRSTCPPLSPSPHANSFIKGTAVINTHSYCMEEVPTFKNL